MLAKFLSITIDWNFWHNWFHEKVIRDGFQGFAKFLSAWFDVKVIDDSVSKRLVNGVRKSAQGLSKLQTGFVRNYALAVFVGVVAIIGYLVIR
jgi:NADH:ubiquinone oxidoreductase subunit 5 (subunit L)/multisubunit Na+/H+ antiporter MnhA subunit